MKRLTGALIIFLAGLATGTTYHNEIFLVTKQQLQEIEYSQTVPDSGTSTLEVKAATPKIDLCFTPPGACGHLIAQFIDQAQSSIYMQAYGLTHPEIISAIIQAKQRGVEVRVLLDRSNVSQKYSKIKELRQAGIEVGIDKVPGIAHNKVIIIDGLKTITGSFNFTVSADKRNAENVVVIEDAEIAHEYLQNWLNRKVLSRE